jgi:hypothetical protein
MTEVPTRPFTSGELDELGITRSQLRMMVADGLVRRVLQGVYAPLALPDDVTTRASCAALVLPPHAVLCDRTAAWIHGVDHLDPRELQQVPALEIASRNGHNRVRRNGASGGERELRPDEVMMVGGVRVTTPLRTATDLARLRGRRRALAALDAFMRHHDLNQEDFRRSLVRFAGRRGVKQLRELIGYASPLAESPPESWTRMAIIDAGLAVPEPQVTVALPEGVSVRVDLGYRHLKIAVEYDGEEFHTSDEDREHDRERRRRLRDAGWKVIVIRRNDLYGNSLDAWLTELREAIAERTPPRPRVYARGEDWSGSRPTR